MLQVVLLDVTCIHPCDLHCSVHPQWDLQATPRLVEGFPGYLLFCIAFWFALFIFSLAQLLSGSSQLIKVYYGGISFFN